MFDNFRYPNTNFYNSDLRELIAMYKKLLEDYDSIKQMVEESVRDYDSLINDNSEIKQRMTKIESAMKELENRIKREVEQTVKDGMGSAVELIRKENSELLKEFTQYVSDINKLVQNLKNYVNDSISKLNFDMSNTRQSLIKYSDSEDKKLYKYIDEECRRIEKEISDVKIYQGEVIDPVDNEQKSVQNTIYNIYYNLKSWALRAVDYAKVEISADEYDKLNLSAWSYDYLAKWYVKEKRDVIAGANSIFDVIDVKIKELTKSIENRTKAYSPISGLVISTVDFCYEICSLMRNLALEAIEYDSISSTAEFYDSKELTAYMYDWFASLYFTTDNYSIEAFDYDSLSLGALQYDMLGMPALVYDLNAKLVLYGI